jgi:hypothetical protein
MRWAAVGLTSRPCCYLTGAGGCFVARLCDKRMFRALADGIENTSVGTHQWRPCGASVTALAGVAE